MPLTHQSNQRESLGTSNFRHVNRLASLWWLRSWGAAY